jgi:hypothetical protein
MPHPARLRILLTNVGIANRTGTEIVVLDLASGLAKAGQFPMIWAPLVDPEVAAQVLAAGIPVVSRLEDLPAVPDIIHGHHHLETIQALRQFPTVPAIFVCNSGLAWYDAPPRHPRIRQFVAVDEFCRERLVGVDWMDPRRISVVWNAVDMDRQRQRPPLPERPRRAVIFSNYAGPDTHVEAVQEACRRMGIVLVTVGSGVGNLSSAPEDVLPEYDLVFAKARCAIEAMASGCAVILCDTAGLGAMVTTANVKRLRPWNFGFRVLQRPLDPDLITQEIQRYDAVDAGQVSSYMRAHARLEDAVDRYLAIYRSVLSEQAAVERDVEWYADSRPLQIEDQASLKLQFAQVPELATARQHFMAEVTLDNRSPVPIATAAPWPCLLTYRWLSAWNGAVVVEHGHRSILQPPAWPNVESAYSMRIIAPSEPGEYVLRATIIQEGWRWLDSLAPPVRADTPVWVAAADGELTPTDPWNPPAAAESPRRAR